MGFFENSIVQVTASVGTQPTLIWNPANTSATAFGSLGSVPSGAVISALGIINTGTANMYVGFGTVVLAGTTGVLVPANGGQLVLPNYTATGGATLNEIWANTGTVGWTTSATVGIPTVISVV